MPRAASPVRQRPSAREPGLPISVAMEAMVRPPTESPVRARILGSEAPVTAQRAAGRGRGNRAAEAGEEEGRQTIAVHGTETFERDARRQARHGDAGPGGHDLTPGEQAGKKFAGGGGGHARAEPEGGVGGIAARRSEARNHRAVRAGSPRSLKDAAVPGEKG